MNELKKTTPWHVWAVGILSLLWNGMGVMDFVMTQSRNQAWLSQFTEPQLEFFTNIPGWVTATWAIAVFGAMLGSAMLLVRSRLAFPVFAISLLAMILTSVRNYGMANAWEVTGPAAASFSVVIFLIGLALTWYARSQQQAGILT